ncbi:MAG: YdcF family protein [Clostridia bacterium]|nr:YdcF family protein [Clostridia bacterium]
MWAVLLSLLGLGSFWYYGLCCYRLSLRCSISYFWLLLGLFFSLSAISPRFFLILSPAFFLFWLLFGAFLLQQRKRSEKRDEPHVLVVLGARNDGTLPREIFENRVKLAAEVMAANPEISAVLSGGSVFGEKESEAQSLKAALIQRGVDQNRLICEEESRTTVENFCSSLPYLKDAKVIGVVTSGFHRYRAERSARAAGLKDLVFYSAEAPKWFLPHLYIREFFTFMTDLLRGKLAEK